MPINVTLLFSREHYLAAAEAFLRGIERRIAAGLNPNVGSVASVFISRWDAAVASKTPESSATNSASPSLSVPTRRPVIFSARRAGSASTTSALVRNDCCGPALEPRIQRPPTFFTSRALAAPFTVNTMPEGTLKALAAHTEMGELLPADGGNCEEVLAQFAKAGIDVDALAAQLQDEGAEVVREVVERSDGGDFFQVRACTNGRQLKA